MLDALRMSTVCFKRFSPSRSFRSSDTDTVESSSVQRRHSDRTPQSPNKLRNKTSQDFSFELVNEVLGPASPWRQAAISAAEQYYAGEMFRFYAAILAWEQEAARGATKRQLRNTANKLIGLFVESGGRYENGCLSASTRSVLLERKNLHLLGFFDVAKLDVAKDIVMNHTLRSILESFRVACDGSEL